VTPTFSLPHEAAAYLEALRAELADLPAEEREDLLADVEASLAENPDAVVARLGSPRDFALELRAAAGLEGGAAAPGNGATLERAVAILRTLAASPRTAALRRLLDRLAPIGWAVRGYVLVAAFALAIGADFSTSEPEVPHFGSGAVGLLIVLAAIAGSVWAGLHAGRRVAVVANVVAVVAAVAVVAHLAGRPAGGPTQVLVVQTEQPQGLLYDGVAVRNLYPYGRDGRLLHDVLLYDEHGRPIDIGGPAFADLNRRVLETRAGRPIYNSFPIRYFDPGTRKVAHPDASPPVRFPHIATPPLRRR
jgi:hypothetical protein